MQIPEGWGRNKTKKKSNKYVPISVYLNTDTNADRYVHEECIRTSTHTQIHTNISLCIWKSFLCFILKFKEFFFGYISFDTEFNLTVILAQTFSNVSKNIASIH